MKNYFEKYLNKYGDINLIDMPFNDIDSFLFSMVSYVPFEEIKLDEEKIYNSTEIISIIDTMDKSDYNKRKKKQIALTKSIFESNRFKSFNIIRPVLKESLDLEMRFFAISIVSDNFIYVSYRGTDSTVVGWKEDLNMSYIYPLPAQIEASIYLDNILKLYHNHNIYVGGHSKGGNLSVYASALNACNNIKGIYSFDGPGFLSEFYELEGYKRIENKIYKFIPKSSIFGLMLESSNNYRVIRSDGKNIMQHDPFTWIIDKTDFLYFNDVSKKYKNLSKSINEWVKSIDVEKRKLFCDSIYLTFMNMNITEFKNLKTNMTMFKRAIPKVFPFVLGLDKKVAKEVFEICGLFLKIYIANELSIKGAL